VPSAHARVDVAEMKQVAERLGVRQPAWIVVTASSPGSSWRSPGSAHGRRSHRQLPRSAAARIARHRGAGTPGSRQPRSRAGTRGCRHPHVPASRMRSHSMTMQASGPQFRRYDPERAQFTTS